MSLPAAPCVFKVYVSPVTSVILLLNVRLQVYGRIPCKKSRKCSIIAEHAGVAELADAYASGAYGQQPVGVQVPSPAPFFI